MPWAAAAAVVGAVVAGGASIYAADKQAGAAKNATDVQLQMFNQTQANEAPYMAAGGNALSALQRGLGIGPGVGGSGYGSLTKPFSMADYVKSPGYEFQLNQGMDAINNSAAARGGVNSGNTLKSLTQYGQGLAAQDYQQAYQNYVGQQQQQFSMLDTVAGSGQNAAAKLGALGADAATNIGNNITGAASVQGAGIVGAGNAINGGINNYLQLQYLMGANNPNNYNYSVSGSPDDFGGPILPT